MADFRVGDEVVATDYRPEGVRGSGARLDRDTVYVVEAVGFVHPYETVLLVGHHNTVRADGFYAACVFRKVQKRSSDLSIETFLTIKPGYEEPKRTTPARKRERA